jgi:hypothetical protein
MDEIKIFVTNTRDDNLCKCQFCDTTIAAFKNDIMIPSTEECYKNGNVPIPNFGWFCSQKCALDYEAKFDIRFEKTGSGKIDYYI